MRKKETSIVRIYGRRVFPYFFVLSILILSACGNDGFKSAFQNESGSNFPVPGNSGNLSSAYTSLTTINVQWQQSNDDSTAASNLQYKVFCSQSRFYSYEEAVMLATELTSGWTLGITSLQVSLAAATGFQWCNVYVRDENGLISAYNGVKPTMFGNVELTPGGGGVINMIRSTTNNKWYLEWVEPVASGIYQYRVFCSTSLTALTTNSVPIIGSDVGEVTYGWTQNISSAYVTLAMPVSPSLPTGISSISSLAVVSAAIPTLYYNVYVRDANGNIRAYNQTICDINTPPNTGSGAITATPKAAKKVDLAWTAATDSQTGQNQLQYCIYSSEVSDAYSAYNTVLTYSAAVAGAAGLSPISVLEMPWTTNVTTCTAKMDKTSQYYFNVFVRDEHGNISPYIPASAITY